MRETHQCGGAACVCVSFEPLTIALPGNFAALSKGESQEVLGDCNV